MNRLDVLKQAENISIAIEDHLREQNEEVRIQKLARLMYSTLAAILIGDVFNSHKLASEIVNGFDMSMLKVLEKLIDVECNYVSPFGIDDRVKPGWIIIITISDFKSSQFMKKIASFLIKIAFKQLIGQKVLSVTIV